MEDISGVKGLKIVNIYEELNFKAEDYAVIALNLDTDDKKELQPPLDTIHILNLRHKQTNRDKKHMRHILVNSDISVDVLASSPVAIHLVLSACISYPVCCDVASPTGKLTWNVF